MQPEDVYEDLDEAEDEDLEDAVGEDSDLLERRRRRNRARGRGYNRPRIEKSFVTQAQLQAATERIGKDIRALDASVRSLESAARKSQHNVQQSLQMMALLPLLTKKTFTLAQAAGGMPPGTKVVVDSGDTLTTMLPLMMLMPPSGSTGPGQGAMDPMMMMMMVLMLSGK
jgi:hypothetical protein